MREAGLGWGRYNYRGAMERVAIVDFDAHYGDGTAACVLNLAPRTVVKHAGCPLAPPLPRRPALTACGARGSFGTSLRVPSCKPWLDESDPDHVSPRPSQRVQC